MLNRPALFLFYIQTLIENLSFFLAEMKSAAP